MVVVTAATTLSSSLFFVSCSFFFSILRLLFSLYTIKVHMVLPQDDLTEATTTLTVPEQPVVLGAYALALVERGEDGGTGPSVASVAFEKSLADYISKDTSRTLNETVWYAS